MIERNEAIKIIWMEARKRGWSNEILHARIEALGIIDFPSIAI